MNLKYEMHETPGYKFLFNFMILLFVCSATILISCQKEQPDNFIINEPTPNDEVTDTNRVELSVDSCVLIPIGRLTKKGSSVDISINGNIFYYETLDDGLGGYWAVLPYKAFDKVSELNIKITKHEAALQLAGLTNDSTTAYLRSSKLINWNEIDIRLMANHIIDKNKTTTENAITIQEFVMNYLNFDDTYSHYFGGFTACQTYYDKKGVCINFSRLFIVLCRAVNIRSRSVSGVIYKEGEVGSDCFYHHQWCEFLDENNKWRTLDLTYSSAVDITDIKYIDFTYCAEETEIFSDYYSEFMEDLGKPFKTDNECVVIYCYLPTVGGAKFGFKLLEDNRPESIVFDKTITLKKVGKVVTINNLL